MTLLLGPPSSGKSTLLWALSGKLDGNLQKSGTITYNGHNFDEFYVHRACAYISQTDSDIAELTVRETFDFAARCQGASEGFSGYMRDLTHLEKERNIRPAPEIDAYMKALLQPAPETFDLFDDLLLLSEGYLVYEGPRSEVSGFFESLGFRLPPRKSIADFLQEVTSKKDQAQYWGDPLRPYQFIPVSKIAEEFKKSRYGLEVESSLSRPYDRTKSHPSALPKIEYDVSDWELFKACFLREILLISRHRFLYVFRTVKVAMVAFVACTLYLRTRIHPDDVPNGELYMSCLFYSSVHMMFNGFFELPLMIFRLPVFYKQRDNLFYPAWAWSITSSILRVPYSVIEAVVWSGVMFYTVGFASDAGRFFRFIFVLFCAHQMALGLFRSMAVLARDIIIANTFGSAALLAIFLLGGFIIPKDALLSNYILNHGEGQ